ALDPDLPDRRRPGVVVGCVALDEGERIAVEFEANHGREALRRRAAGGREKVGSETPGKRELGTAGVSEPTETDVLPEGEQVRSGEGEARLDGGGEVGQVAIVERHLVPTTDDRLAGIGCQALRGGPAGGGGGGAARPPLVPSGGSRGNPLGGEPARGGGGGDAG